MNARLDDTPAAPRPSLPPLLPMRSGDLDAVVAVEVRAYPFPWTRGNFTDSLASGYTARLACDGDGGVVGYFIAMAGVAELHLLNLTVAPEHQGQGHGRALLRAVAAEALALPATRLLLEVRESNQRARRLYQGHGFAEVGRRRAYYPARDGREDAIVMSLALPEDRDGLD